MTAVKFRNLLDKAKKNCITNYTTGQVECKHIETIIREKRRGNVCYLYQEEYQTFINWLDNKKQRGRFKVYRYGTWDYCYAGDGDYPEELRPKRIASGFVSDNGFWGLNVEKDV